MQHSVYEYLLNKISKGRWLVTNQGVQELIDCLSHVRMDTFLKYEKCLNETFASDRTTNTRISIWKGMGYDLEHYWLSCLSLEQSRLSEKDFYGIS